MENYHQNSNCAELSKAFNQNILDVQSDLNKL